ncbi:MAG TPA: methyltransferase domain-containing protein [Dehalococcoidia bacterium]|nr:methyltransferase domain-containing protein [Dehalococcoidia bacterium]
MDAALYEQHQRLEDTHWWFLGRRYLVLRELARHGGSEPGPILDVGCGTGGMLPHLNRIAPAIGLDPAPEAAAACRQRGVAFVNASGTEMPFATATFGTVTALDVVEHVPDDVGMLRELYRVLRPGGLLLLTVPAYQFLWSQHDEFNHHQRRYRRRTLQRAVRQAGFRIARISYYNTLLFPAAVARKALMRFQHGDGPASHLEEVPRPLNAFLRGIMLREEPIVARWDLPFGASLICAARRPAGAAAATSCAEAPSAGAA